MNDPRTDERTAWLKAVQRDARELEHEGRTFDARNLGRQAVYLALIAVMSVPAW